MPLYEYRCETCDHRFEALVTGGQKPPCAQCGGKKLEKLFSAFAVASGSGASASAESFGSAPGGCGTCGDPRGPGSCSTGG